MSAKVSTFSRGVTFVSSGETGTQANEFEAAIKSVTSSTTVGAVFVYDTRNDSDPSWRKRCQGLSWFDETLNTATRGGRREFPSVALIVADNASGSETVTVYDLDDPSMPMWMVFNAHTPAWETNATFVSTNTLTSVYALNGRMYVGGAYGLVEIDFISEQQTNYRPISSTQRVRHKKSGAIVDRNDTSGQFRITATPIVANGVNDVAATYLEGGELDSLGLVRPVAALATDSGVSVIHPNGSVYDLASTTHANNDVRKVFFTDDGMVGYNFEASGFIDRAWAVGLRKIPYADANIQAYDNAVNLERYMPPVSSATTGLTTNSDEYSSTDAQVNAVAPTSKNGLAIGYGDRLSIVKRNPSNMEEGAVAFIDSDYNTGYMLGDIRLAALANANAGDRSVKGNTLAVNNTSGSDYVEEAVVATNAELKAYSNFKAGNYLSRASDTDFDFGTGDFSIMFWVKLADTVNTTETVLERAHGGNALFNVDFNAGKARLQTKATAGGVNATTAQTDLSDSRWHQVCIFRRNGKGFIYVDANYDLSYSGGNTVAEDLDNGSAVLHIGQNTGNGNPLANGSLSLLRISATAPTPQQVKEIYEAEKPLFRAGAKCLLQSDGGSPNLVNDLSYDSTTGLLHAYQGGTNTAETRFKGLEAVDSYGAKSDGWSASGATGGVAAGGVKATYRAAATGGVIVDLPAIDVRGDINTADTKLPDDGKLHFTGVTTDATPTVVGQIPIAGGENYIVKANVIGCRYQSADSAHRIIVDLKGGFSRTMSGNVIAEPLMSKLSELEWSSSTLDVEYDVDTTANTIRIKVTGHSAVNVEWNATVEVQRISEKTYER